ncbi:MAG: hypothetical protein ABIK73_08880 [candidate division WOR-3 bacterium]
MHKVLYFQNTIIIKVKEMIGIGKLMELRKEIKIREIKATANGNTVVITITTETPSQALKLKKAIDDLYSTYRWLL